MSNRKALVITYHVKNCVRLGGIHFFIRYLTQAGYDIDWVTGTVSVSWLLKRGDRSNARNFIDLVRGISWEENNTLIRHFAVPVWIPARIARLLGMELGKYHYPRWEKLRKRLRDSYDLILAEGVACQYAEQLRTDYPRARIIYRPSDALKTFTSFPDPERLELDMIKASDLVCCVDENHMNYYKSLAAGEVRQQEKIKLLRNPLTTQADIEFAENFTPSQNEPSVVYVGVSYVDHQLASYAASHNKDAAFYMIGPAGKSHDNVVYTGMLSEEEYEKYLFRASVGITPVNLPIAYGYTRKIIKYMKYLLPIAATCSDNYLNAPGFFCADTKEEFSQKISEFLKYSPEDREKLREGYLRVMKVFSQEEARRKFLEYIG